VLAALPGPLHAEHSSTTAGRGTHTARYTGAALE